MTESQTLLLAAGVIRVAILGAGVVFSIRFRRIVSTAAFSLLMLNAALFSAHYAGLTGHGELLTLAVHLSPLAAALLVVALVIYPVRKDEHLERWHL